MNEMTNEQMNCSKENSCPVLPTTASSIGAPMSKLNLNSKVFAFQKSAFSLNGQPAIERVNS